MANTKIQSEQIADSAIVTDRIAADAITTAKIADNVALGGSPTTTTQSSSDNSTKIATTAYVTSAVASLIDSAPSTLNTLNEIAAALNDDANFNTTVTNSIAAKLPLAGGTMTGNFAIGKEDPNITLTDSSTSRTLAMFVDNNNSVVRASGPLLLQVGSQSAITIDASRNATFAGTISAGSGITSAASFAVTGGAAAGISEGLLIDWSTNLARFLTYDSSTGSEIAFYTQPNGGSTTQALRIDSSQNSTFANDVTVGGDLTVDTNVLHVNSTNNNVGIGDASPPSTVKLAVQADGVAIRLDGTANTSRQIMFRNTSSSNPAQLKADGSWNIFTEDSGTVIKLFTDNDSSKGFEIDGGAATLTNSSHSVMTLQAGTNSSASLRLKNDAQDFDVNVQTNDNFALYNHTTNKQPITVSPTGYMTLQHEGGDFGLQIRTNGTSRSGLVIDKPNTSTIMASALVLSSDETYRLGTASHYHMIMYQNGATRLYGDDSAVMLGVDSTGMFVTGGRMRNPTSNGTWEVRTGGRNGTGTYTLFTNGSSSTQSAGTVEVWGIYGTPSGASYTKYLISGNRSIATVISEVETNSVPTATVSWNGADLEVTNSNSSLYYHVRVELHDIGNGWSPTWGDFPDIS